MQTFVQRTMYNKAMNNVIVRLIRTPDGSDGFVLEDPAGDYNVYISDRLGSQRQKEVYLHELCHIKNGHLDDHEKTTEECEAEIRDELRRQPELGSSEKLVCCAHRWLSHA